jgi:diacylglycerol O-acyltransferase
MDKLRPDDHFMILLEGDETPMHIGALILLDVGGRDNAAAGLRTHLVERLPHTPLVRMLQRAPLGFDSDVWLPADDVDLDEHIIVHLGDTPLRTPDLHAFIEQHVMIRLDLSRPPFVIHVLDNIESGRLALHVKVHHCVADGVGFQTILGLLSDDPLPTGAVATSARRPLPTRHEWLAASLDEFRQRKGIDARWQARRRAAHEALGDPSLRRADTPRLSISGPTSVCRRYTTVTLPFGELRRVARALDATVNDLYMALVGTAMREYLLELGDLPEMPLVANAARSYRRPEHGAFGNRIVAIHPHLATHLEEPTERLRAIQDSMAIELRRTAHDEALLNQPETPFGPAVRRRRFAARRASGAAILPGNVTVSNVPGPSHVRTMAGMPVLSNHPTPLLGSGRPLNFTARRNADSFDVGVMADAEKIADVEHIADLFADAFARYTANADAPHHLSVGRR